MSEDCKHTGVYDVCPDCCICGKCVSEKIEKLQSDLARKRKENIEAGDLILELQVKLARAEQTLKSISKNSCCDSCQEAKLVAEKYFSDKEKEAK